MNTAASTQRTGAVALLRAASAVLAAPTTGLMQSYEGGGCVTTLYLHPRDAEAVVVADGHGPSRFAADLALADRIDRARSLVPVLDAVGRLALAMRHARRDPCTVNMAEG